MLTFGREVSPIHPRTLFMFPELFPTSPSEVAIAKNMTVYSISTLPMPEFEANWEALVAAGIEIPVCSRAAVVSKHVTSLLTSALGGQGAIDEVFHRTKPWSTELTTSDTWKPDDKRTWRFHASVDLPTKDNVEWFHSTLFDYLLVRLIEAGQLKSKEPAPRLM